jgi:riboflavin kinase, archaea type
MMKKKHVIISGQACRGLGVSPEFTCIAWVRDQLISKLKITPHPGTFNIEVENQDDLEQLKKIRAGKGIIIVPEDPAFCSATCYPVVVAGKINGAIVIPNVADYPLSKVEVVASCNIKETLSIADGDIVQLEIDPAPQEFACPK